MLSSGQASTSTPHVMPSTLPVPSTSAGPVPRSTTPTLHPPPQSLVPQHGSTTPSRLPVPIPRSGPSTPSNLPLSLPRSSPPTRVPTPTPRGGGQGVVATASLARTPPRATSPTPPTGSSAPHPHTVAVTPPQLQIQTSVAELQATRHGRGQASRMGRGPGSVKGAGSPKYRIRTRFSDTTRRYKVVKTPTTGRAPGLFGARPRHAHASGRPEEAGPSTLRARGNEREESSGRTDEWARACEPLGRDEEGYVLVVGPSGSGKTSVSRP